MALRFSRLVYEDGIEYLYKGLCGRLIQDGAILLGAAQDLVDFRFLARSSDLLVVFGDGGDGSVGEGQGVEVVLNDLR